MRYVLHIIVWLSIAITPCATHAISKDIVTFSEIDPSKQLQRIHHPNEYQDHKTRQQRAVDQVLSRVERKRKIERVQSIYHPNIPATAPLDMVVTNAPTVESETLYYDHLGNQIHPNSLVAAASNTETIAADDFRFWVQGGASEASLNWNIGVTGIDILSELTWEGVKSIRVEAGGEYRCNGGWCDGMMIFTSLYGDKEYSGTNQDSDFTTSGRVGEFSRSINSINGSQLRGFSAALGYDFAYEMPHARFSLIPKIGYSYDTQEMRMNNGHQIIPATGPFAGLNSTYDAEWDGPFAGIASRVLFFNQHELRAGASVHRSDYEASANWNLRTGFAHPVSFEHFAKGSGRKVELGYSYWFTPKWEVRLDATYEQYKVGEGEDITYFSNGTAGIARFNEAKFKSHSYVAGVGYSF